MAKFDTLLNIVSDASIELGLGAVAAVAGSSNAMTLQMRGLLRSAGQRLALARAWRHLCKEHTFTTTADSTYPLPADFSDLYPQTAYDRTQSLRMGGPLTAQGWQALKARPAGGTTCPLFRVRESTIEVWPQPPLMGATVAFEYASRYWVQGTGQAAPDKDAPSADTDVLKFDRLLLVAALKRDWKKAKGQDTSAATEDYDAAYASAASADAVAAPRLRLDGRSDKDRLISGANASGLAVGSEYTGGLY